MLAFARRQELKAAAVDVPDLVLGMADLLQRSIGPSIHMETRFAIGLPKAYIDGNQLELALVNLVVNARDATPRWRQHHYWRADRHGWISDADR